MLKRGRDDDDDNGGKRACLAIGGAHRIHVKIRNGPTVVADVPSFDVTIGSVKASLYKVCDIPDEWQRLVFFGRQLTNDKTLRSYGIHDGSVLHLVNLLVLNTHMPFAVTPPDDKLDLVVVPLSDPSLEFRVRVYRDSPVRTLTDYLGTKNGITDVVLLYGATVLDGSESWQDHGLPQNAIVYAIKKIDTNLTLLKLLVSTL